MRPLPGFQAGQPVASSNPDHALARNRPGFHQAPYLIAGQGATRFGKGMPFAIFVLQHTAAIGAKPDTAIAGNNHGPDIV